MSAFSTRKRIGIDGTEAWVVSADHITNLLDLVFKNRFGEIWLFNNDLTFFKNPELFKTVYINKIVGDLGSRVGKVKVFVEKEVENEVVGNQCQWLQKRFHDLLNFIDSNKLTVFPRFLFGRTSDLQKHVAFKKLFDKKGIPPHHTWVFYLHGESLRGARQHGIALFRPTEFPFANRESPLALSWHLSDKLILNSKHREDFDSCFANPEFFSQVFPGKTSRSNKRAGKPVKKAAARFEGLAFGEPADVLVLAPADDEMSYLRKMFGQRLHEVVTPGTIEAYCFVTRRERSVILATVGEGNIAASVATSRLLDAFQPKHVILFGVAGAVPSRGRHAWAIGDIIVGQSVIDYEWGKVVEKDDSWTFVPKTDIETTWGGEQPYRLLYAKACKIANGGWQMTPAAIKKDLTSVVGSAEVHNVNLLVKKFILGPSRAHTGIVGSGSKVVASRKYVEEVVDKKCADINSFETEAAGVLYACSQHVDGKIDCLVIRGVMDLADGKTRNNKIRKGLRHIAKIVCGRFMSHLLDEL